MPDAQQDASRPSFVPYAVSIKGGSDAITALLRRLSILVRDQDKTPRSYGMLYARIDTDLKVFERALRSEGYYDSRITRQIDSTGDKAQIVFHVFPGPLYKVESIDLVFPGHSPDADVQKSLKQSIALVAGDPARAADIVAAEDRLLSRLPQLGHPLAKPLERRVVIDHDSDTARITYRFDAGPLILFGPVSFRGTKSVKTDYLERLIPWESGATYDQTKVEAFRRRLIATRLFGSVHIGFAESIATLQNKTGPVAAPMVFDLTESSQRAIAIGAGYSTGEGIGVGISWEHDNLFGAEERLTLTATAAEVRQALTADFRKPNFRRKNQILTAKAGAIREDTDAFDSLELTSGAGLERLIGRYWTVGAALEASYTSVQENDIRRTFLLGALPLSAAFDMRDDLLDPTKGLYVRTSVTPHLAEQDGVFSFYKSELAASLYRALDRDADTILAGRVALGSITGAKTARLPASRRFYAGGGGSVRGFGFQNVGPLDEDGTPSGGRSLFEASVEARIKISDTIGLVPFMDAGEVTDKSMPQFDNLRWGAGLGFRYYTSFAPIRVDIATPVNRRPGESRIQFYISIGQSF